MMNIYGKIEPITFQGKVDEESMKLILFDPSEIYNRINIDKYNRRQSFNTTDVFPNLDPQKCACGCNKKLSGRAKRWYHPSHSELCYRVLQILNGDTDLIKNVLLCYVKNECCKCHCQPYQREKKTIKKLFNGQTYTDIWTAAGIQVDHIVAVKNGGGGCWLGNYQLICHVCHRAKTTVDNHIRNRPGILPISTEFN